MLWTLFEKDRLSTQARTAIETEENEVYVSIISPWELAIKRARHPPIVVPPRDLHPSIEEQQFKLLSVEWHHVASLVSLPLHHRDPFDRMLMAQAVADGMTIVTNDRKMRRYSVSLMPAT
jgi:PIN domain nuclease of toxin-antitoxin system